MIRFVSGSLFDSDAQTLVNPVNTIGVSGAGLAKEFKKRFPAAQKLYETGCRDKTGLHIGEMLLWAGTDASAPQWVLHLPTKEHWRDPSQLTFIEQGLDSFVWGYRGLGITSIAFPALGCGNGGLDWADVKSVMLRHLEQVEIPVAIHEPMTREARREN